MTYPTPLRVIHWSIALLVTCQLAIAVVLTQLRSLEYGQFVLGLHRQLGLIILMGVAARFVAAYRHKAPRSTGYALPVWQLRAAAIVHHLFLVLLIVQPLVGMFVAWARGDTVSLLGLVSLPAPWEISDAGREQLMTVHATIAIVIFALCVIHIGAVIFNSVVRRVSVIDRMLPPSAPDRLVNRVSIGAQLTLTFGLVVTMALIMGINAVATYRQFSRSTTEFQQGEVAAADQTRAAQVAWKELLGLAAAGRSGGDEAQHVQELADTAKSSLDEAATHTPAGELRSQIEALVGRLARFSADTYSHVDVVKEIDGHLQEIVDSQAFAVLQRRTDNEQAAARGHDLIVVTVLPMILAGVIATLLLARSVTGSLSRMGVLIRGIKSEQRDAQIQVVGHGEFAALTRDIMSMREAVEQRNNAAAEQRARFDAERLRLAEEHQEREAAAERERRAERAAQRERMAAEFERQVAGIVDTVAGTAEKLTAAAGSMAQSASNTTKRSREASSLAELTSSTASQLSSGTEGLSSTARSVRGNAETSQARAMLAVKEAAAAKEQIDCLLTAARQISTITDVISGVARQTNLLAINARVESARAGEAGRGFSIVANEVKALANQTRDATLGIGKQIEEVTSAAARSSESLERLREVIQGLEGAAAAIFKSSDEQFASTRDMAERVAEISTSTSAVAQNIREAQNTAGATEQLSGQVAQAAEIIDQQAEQLSEQVAQFVLQLRASSGASSLNPAQAPQPSESSPSVEHDSGLAA